MTDTGTPFTGTSCFLRINERELATILAALRYWQATPDSFDRRLQIIDIATDGGTFTPLTDDEIDLLCESINMGASSVIEPAPAVEPAPEPATITPDFKLAWWELAEQLAWSEMAEQRAQEGD